MTSQLKVAFIYTLRMPWMCLVYSFDMLLVSVSTTRQLQASGQLVQELNICIVCAKAHMCVSMNLFINTLWIYIPRCTSAQGEGFGFCQD